MTVRNPLSAFSEVVDERRRWTSDWYSWLADLTSGVAAVGVGYIVTPYAYGAVGDGVVDDTVAMQAALATGQYVDLLDGVFLISDTLVFNDFQWMVNGTINKNFNGDLIDMTAQQCAMVRMRINGNGGTFSGRGVIIGSLGGNTQRQFMDRCFILDCQGRALEFTADQAGFLFTCNDCAFGCTNTATEGVLLPTDTVGTFGGRWFYNIHQGGLAFIDYAGGRNTHIHGGSSNKMTWSSASAAYTTIIGHRIGMRAGLSGVVNGSSHRIVDCDVAGSLTINGSDQIIGPNVHSGNILILGSGTTGSVIHVTDATFTDNNSPGEGSNQIYGHAATFVPTFSSTGVAPTNFTATGSGTRDGYAVTLQMVITFGAGFTAGTGGWTFTAPAPWGLSGAANAYYEGPATYHDASTGNVYHGVALMVPGSPTISIMNTGGTATNWGGTNPPVAPAVNDFIILNLRFQTKA